MRDNGIRFFTSKLRFAKFLVQNDAGLLGISKKHTHHPMIRLNISWRNRPIHQLSGNLTNFNTNKNGYDLTHANFVPK